MNGDGLYANENTPSAGGGRTWPTDIWFHDSSIDSVGRNAFTINSGRRVTLERNAIDRVGGSVLDIEPDLDTQGAVDLDPAQQHRRRRGPERRLYSMHFVALCQQHLRGRRRRPRHPPSPGNRVTGGAPNSANTPERRRPPHVDPQVADVGRHLYQQQHDQGRQMDRCSASSTSTG